MKALIIIATIFFIFSSTQLKAKSRKPADDGESPMLNEKNSRNDVVTNLHWVGIFNIKSDPSNKKRAYSTQILSLLVVNRDKNKRFYVEVGEPTFANKDMSLPLAGINKSGGDVDSTSVEDFVTNGGEFKFSVGDYYFAGTAKNMNSKLEGLVYEKSNDLLAGYFELFPRHDGSDSYGWPIKKEHEPCFEYRGEYTRGTEKGTEVVNKGIDPTTFDIKTLPRNCFGSGKP